MSDTPKFDRRLEVIYCDDVRQEVGNKTTLVGIYQGAMEVVHQGSDEATTVIPKLCIALTAHTPRTQPFSKLIFRILKDYETLQEFSLPSSAFEIEDSSDETPPDGAYFTFRALITISPFSVDSSFVLRVRAETESETLAAPALRVKYTPRQTTENEVAQ